ncbi:MAG: DUF262 domain-containing HNH endonuclease family protein [Pseudomonadota bacterium]
MPDIANPAYHPEKKSIGELLAMTNPAIIVPDWQRNYSWRKVHVETFWFDLLKFLERVGNPINSEYFFGSIVLVSGQGERVLLLDGQQRLATSTILLSAIRDVLVPLDQESADWIQTNYLSSYDPIKGAQIHKLRLNVYDRMFFQRLVAEQRGEDYVAPEPEFASHSLIKDAKDFFAAQLTEGCAGLENSEACAWLKRVVSALTTNFTVIAAYSENENSAAEVFETLNDRGIGLSTPDLLRNLIIRRGGDGQQEQIVDCWEDVISFRTDNLIKAFLRHHWISRYGDVKTQSLYREVKVTVEDNNIASLALSTELRDSARLYRRLLNADFDEEIDSEILTAIGSLGAGANILFPGLLSIFDILEGAERSRALSALMNIYVRDGIIGQMENSILENRFYRAARDLRQGGNVQGFCTSLSSDALSDDDVRNRFGRLSLKNNGQRRYLLTKLEMEKRPTGELNIASSSRVHVEHIYPQTPEPGLAWANHERVINRIGNLTLLDRRINSAIKNGPFEAKRPHYEGSDIFMTRELVEVDDWNIDRVAARQAELGAFVNQIWPLVE